MGEGSRNTPKMPLRVAMAGLGYFGAYQLEAWDRIGETSVVALAEKSEDAAQKVSGRPDIGCFADVAAMLAGGEYDVLDIATPPSTHAQILREAIGKVPVIVCQKPFCTSLSEAEAMAGVAEHAGSRLIIHENFRFMPWYRVIREQIDAGLIGEVIQAQFRLRPGDGAGEDAYTARQPYFRVMKRFLMHETGIHWIDVFRYLFGEPASAFADLWKTNPVIAGEDSCYLVFGFESGMRAVLDANRTLDHASDNSRLTMGEFMIEGSTGTLSLNGFGEIAFRKIGENAAVTIPCEFEDRNFGGDCVYHFQRHVVDHLINGDRLETAAADYLANLRIEEAVYRSAEEGRRIELD